jgi:hypothetical protein
MQPFNVIRLSLYQGRGMVIGGRSGATGNISNGGGNGVAVPAKPWMGFQNYGYAFLYHVCQVSLLTMRVLMHVIAACNVMSIDGTGKTMTSIKSSGFISVPRASASFCTLPREWHTRTPASLACFASGLLGQINTCMHVKPRPTDRAWLTLIL